jgi:hypothetical protein
MLEKRFELALSAFGRRNGAKALVVIGCLGDSAMIIQYLRFGALLLMMGSVARGERLVMARQPRRPVFPVMLRKVSLEHAVRISGRQAPVIRTAAFRRRTLRLGQARTRRVTASSLTGISARPRRAPKPTFSSLEGTLGPPKNPEIQRRESSDNLYLAYRRALQLANIRARSYLRLSSLLFIIY